MTDTTPGYVQLQADSTGKKIRNVAVDLFQPDGTTATVEMQVIAIADENGKLWMPPEDWQDSMLAATMRTNELLELMISILET